MQVARNFFLSREKHTSEKSMKYYYLSILKPTIPNKPFLKCISTKFILANKLTAFKPQLIIIGKTVDQLTLAESAMLAGLPKAPSRNNPITRPHKAIERRNQVLANMRDMAFIDEQAYQQAIHEEDHASFHHLKPTVNARYAAELVRQYLVDSLGEENAYTKGYEITTTIDAKAQSGRKIRSHQRDGALCKKPKTLAS